MTHTNKPLNGKLWWGGDVECLRAAVGLAVGLSRSFWAQDLSCSRTHCGHSHRCPRAHLGPSHGSRGGVGDGGPWLPPLPVLSLHPRAYRLCGWCFLTLSSLNSAIYGAVVPGWRQGFISVVSVVYVLKGSYSNQHPAAEAMGHNTYAFSENKRRGDLDNQDKHPHAQDASRKGWQEWFR